ncbi:hypothetical protein CIW54_07505 [Paraburkholderia sp. T12-10]|nr:hypothetical protein CIW54_07505 [Paraburkholderia sp. T12-10]
MTYHVRIYGLTGDLLLQTWNNGHVSRDMEISAALSRKDVGRIEWWGDGKGVNEKYESDFSHVVTTYPQIQHVKGE